MSKLYYRLCETVQDYGKYIPAEEKISNYIKQEKPYYQSIYMYTDAQVAKANEIIEVEKNGKKIKRPRGISGITDVITSKLVWDFDSKEISESKKDTIELVDRLLSRGIKESALGIYFSGGKGFHVEVETFSKFTPKEFKKLTSSIAKGLKTYDSVVANPSRIFRVAYTKHDSGYFKTRLTKSELNELSVQDVLTIAKDAYEPEALEKTEIPSTLLSLTKEEEKPEKKESTQSNETFNHDINPLGLSVWKNALLQGIIPPGQRSNAFIILAATLKGKGFTADYCYATLKATIRKQAEFYGQDPFSKEEFYQNIIAQVYSPTWQGGTFTEDSFPDAIKDHFNELGIARTSTTSLDKDLVVNVAQGFDNFNKYATEIDNNRLSFGIEALDKILKAQNGHMIGVVAGPGVGKCLKKGTLVLMFDGSLKKVEDIVKGDVLMGDDSTPRNVLGTTVGEETMFDIIPNEGESWGCNESHILSLKCSSDIDDTFKKDKVYNISVKEFITLPKEIKSKLVQYRTGVEFAENKVHFDPYSVGTWLTTGIHEDEKDQLGSIMPFIKDECYIEGEKRIPTSYLVNNRDNRLKLLAALLDGDGTEKNGTYKLITRYEGFRDDVLFLCRSLGYAAYSSKKSVKLKGWDGHKSSYRISISGNLSDVPCNAPISMSQETNVLYTKIKVEEVGKGEYYGFELDGNHLYCLGDFTVTHNTSLALELLSNTSKDGCNSFFGSYDMNSSILFQKLLQRETRMSDDDIYDVYRRNDTEQIEKFKAILEKNYSNVTFCFKVGQSIDDLKRSIANREEVLGKKIDLVVVDYIELILSDKSDATAASAEAAQGLREIANSGRVVVVLLQPNKMSSKADEAPKSYNAAKGSSAIPQAVTSMVGCFRPGYSPEDPSMDKFFGISVLKNRMGPLGTVYFNWDGPTGRITEMEDIQRQELDEFLNWKKENKKDGDHGL